MVIFMIDKPGLCHIDGLILLFAKAPLSYPVHPFIRIVSSYSINGNENMGIGIRT